MKAIAVQTDSAFHAYALKLISDFIQYPHTHLGPPDIGYGEAGIGQPRIPRMNAYTAKTVPPMPEADDFQRIAEGQGDFPFDLFEATYFWLTDQGHSDAPDCAFDTHDRLLHSKSLQYQAGHGYTPIVNRYFQLFGWLNPLWTL